jgi:hypothetical protein
VQENGVAAIAQLHRHGEDLPILPVAHARERLRRPVAVVLRRLDKCDLAVLEIVDDLGEEFRRGLIIGVDDADQRGLLRRLL